MSINLPIGPATIAAPTPAPPQVSRPDPAQVGGAEGFGGMLQGVAEALNEADLMSQQVATGQITDLSQLTAATTKAEIAMQLTVAFRDRAVTAFSEIMRMQV